MHVSNGIIDEQGIFFSANNYVITNKEDDLLIIYHWKGAESKKEDKEKAEEYVKTLLKENEQGIKKNKNSLKISYQL